MEQRDPPQKPGQAREIVVGDGAEQWEAPGTSITSVWLDLEDGLDVEVEGAAETHDPNEGVVIINVIDPATGGAASIRGYRGGLYVAPGGTGAITLTSVSGSLSASDLVVRYSSAGGSGTFNVATQSFSSR
ncbi:MAG TPA: hypothetical protein VFI30_02275 [Nocardioidaceae bacterium]|nr:hypothetical protein [Nocardioidaceae bacterium]